MKPPGGPPVSRSSGPPRYQPPRPGARPPAGQTSAGASVQRTALPPKQHIRCYECNYEFDLTGRMHSTYCPKCRTTLDLAGYTIDTDCRETLKTLGTIRITPRGVVSTAKLVAMDVELSGKIIRSSVEAFGLAVIHPGADFARQDLRSQDLKIEAGAEVTFRGWAVYRNVEVVGTLNANVYATGTVTVRSSGRLTGGVSAARLVVEDGATLSLDANIGPQGLDEARTKREEAKVNPPEVEFDDHIVVPALPPPPLEENPPQA